MDLYIEKLEPFYERGKPFSTLILRALSGIALMAHGYPKILDMQANIELVEKLGFYPGAVWSPALSVSEFGAGLLLLLGLLTRLAASAGFVILSVVAYYHWIFVGEGYAGAEKAIIWASICLYFVFHGASRYSLDHALGREL